MKPIVFILLLLSLSGYAQNLKLADIIGKWSVDRMYIGKVCFVDCRDSAVTINYMLRLAAKHKAKMSGVDTLNLIKSGGRITAEFSEFYLEFFEDSTFQMIDITGAKGKSERGNYLIDKGKLVMHPNRPNPEKLYLRNNRLHLAFNKATLFNRDGEKLSLEFVRK